MDAGLADTPLFDLRWRCSNRGNRHVDMVVTAKYNPKPWRTSCGKADWVDRHLCAPLQKAASEDDGQASPGGAGDRAMRAQRQPIETEEVREPPSSIVTNKSQNELKLVR
jgi:hypothetical protein